MLKAREVLLVGEGNFSFSAVLSGNAGDDVGVTATCHQNEEHAYRQESAALNIQRLRERGQSLFYTQANVRLSNARVVIVIIAICVFLFYVS